ncbi:MAG: SpoIIE family protein phosphatase [Clostridia bacterium]|nr:SpoIIE family protein phosphatase [Clostridia bacterium]
MQNEKREGSVERRVSTRRFDRTFINEGLWGAIYVIASYLLGGCELFFGTYPLGIALICAAPRRVVFIFVGLCASALAATEQGGLLTGIYLIALILRILVRLFIDNSYLPPSETPPADKLRAAARGLFGESVYLRMTAAAVCAFMFSLYRIIDGGYHYYDLFGAIFALAATPAAVLLLSWYFAGNKSAETAEGTQTTRYKYMAGCAAVLAALTFAARDMTFLGVSVAAFGGMLGALVISRRCGMLAGCAAGFICGAAFDLVYSPLFVLAVIAEGLLRFISPTIAAISALAAALLWGFYIDGMDVLTRLLPGLLLADCAYLGAGRVGWLNERAVSAAASEDGKRGEQYYLSARVAADERKMLEISDSFGALSRIFYDLSDKLRRPGILDLRRVCDNVFDAHCPTCPRHEVCWGLEYGGSLDMIARLASSLGEQGRATPDCLPDAVTKRCESIAEICDEINMEAGALTESVLRSEKIGVFALDYEVISKILTDAVDQQRRDYQCSDELTDAVRARLERIGVRADSLLVYGGRRKCIMARGFDAEAVRAESSRICDELSAAVGARLDEPMFEMGSGGVCMTLTSRRRLRVARAGLCRPAEEGDVCGDSICMFESTNDIFYALISDGMGSGSEAAFCSGLATMFLEKMLSSGNRVDTSLKMLNGVLRSKGGAREMECSATVDLLSVDMLTGEAAVIKSGAAPTYVRRGGDIFRLHSETVPLGILGAIDARKTKLDVLPGDVIVMVSDGVSDAGESEWAADVLGYEWEDDLERMAGKLVGRAQSMGSRDDVSAVIVKIEEY